MALRSMTGFGRANGVSNGLSFAVEVRSVNHRFLDIKAKLPRSMNALEALLKEDAASFFKRGRLDIQVLNVALNEEDGPQNVDWIRAQAFIDLHKLVGQRLDVPVSCSTRDVLLAEGVQRTSGRIDTIELDEGAVREAVRRAFEALLVMREREGRHLEVVLLDLILKAREERTKLLSHAQEQIDIHRQKLIERMTTAFGELEESQMNRVMMEAGLLAERCDVCEELDRLAAHFDQFEEICGGHADEAVGRRLDFLCQEIFREVNTTASKSQSIEITRLTIELKAIMERVREQIQNVE